MIKPVPRANNRSEVPLIAVSEFRCRARIGIASIVAALVLMVSVHAAVIEAWVQRYRGEIQNHPQAMAVDGSGNVVVMGYSQSVEVETYFYTAKYAAADGALLWEKRYHGPFDSNEAYAVAVDRSGNVVVTGLSRNANDSDFYTAKYASADGALLWEKRYDSGTNIPDGATAVAVDGSDNVIVTGRSYDGDPFDGGMPNFYTAKYAAADGALLWEKRATGDNPVAVVVDSNGNVVVTGGDRLAHFRDGDFLAKGLQANGILNFNLLEKKVCGALPSAIPVCAAGVL